MSLLLSGRTPVLKQEGFRVRVGLGWRGAALCSHSAFKSYK